MALTFQNSFEFYKKKPEVILYYNSTKSGVETLDRMVKMYTFKRITRRWSVALFYNMIDVSAVMFLRYRSNCNAKIAAS